MRINYYTPPNPNITIASLSIQTILIIQFLLNNKPILDPDHKGHKLEYLCQAQNGPRYLTSDLPIAHQQKNIESRHHKIEYMLGQYCPEWLYFVNIGTSILLEYWPISANNWDSFNFCSTRSQYWILHHETHKLEYLRWGKNAKYLSNIDKPNISPIISAKHQQTKILMN